MEQLSPRQKAATFFWVAVGVALPIWILYALGVTLWLAIPVVLVFYAIFFVFSFGEVMKKTALDCVPVNLRYVYAKPEDFPELDRARFDQLNQQVIALGFEHVAYFTLHSDNEKHSPAFASVVVHRDKYCFAEIGQVFPRDLPPSQVYLTVMSAFEGDGSEIKAPFQNDKAPIPASGGAQKPREEERWVLATTNRAPDAVLWALRSPRRLVSNHEEFTPAQLLQFHVTKRQEIEDIIGIPVSRDLSLETYLARANRIADRLRGVLEKTPGLRFFYDYKYANKPTEWWGEYAHLARKKRRS